MVSRDGGGPQRVGASREGEDRVVASLAHEINNPLQSLLSFLYLMEVEVCVTEKGKQYLELARDEAQRIAQIAYVAMRKLNLELKPEETNVPELLRSVLDFYNTRLVSRGITVSSRYCSDGDMRIYPDALRQAFTNLLLNAVDALPKGGRVHVRVAFAHECTGDLRAGLRVTFADNGEGIAAADLPRVLEPFFTTKGPAGTGLGLALVKDTVHKHGGVLRVRTCTRAGRSGSVFSMFLPAA